MFNTLILDCIYGTNDDTFFAILYRSTLLTMFNETQYITVKNVKIKFNVVT